MTDQADLLFTGGPVYTVPEEGRAMTRAESDNGWPATAAAVRDGRVIAVGTAAELGGLAGDRTRVVELRGRPLLPGFQDAHVHPVFAGMTMLRCDLDGAADQADALARIRAYAEANPDREWIDGSGWRMEWFAGGTPSRELLDGATGSRRPT